MKTLNHICLIAIMLLLISCDPDDGNNNNITASIIGAWQLESIIWGELIEPLNDCQQTQITTFLENETFEVYYDPSENCGFNNFIRSYTLDGSTLNLKISIEENNDTTYSVRCIVLKLNTTTLKYIEVWNSEDGDLPHITPPQV